MSVCPEPFCPLVDPTLIMSAGTGSSTMPGRPGGKARSESNTETRMDTHTVPLSDVNIHSFIFQTAAHIINN